MTVQEALDYINNFTWSKTRLGLSRTRELLDRLGNPQRFLKFIHVAGSNGKGSTCAMLESVLRASGYKTGLYLSPFIEDFRETFQICGEMISEEELGLITETVKEAADAMEDHPSQFELKTAIAMQFFFRNHCDIVVLETGMGGEFDATNVIPAPEAAVIMNIGLEHTEYLGSTLTEIAKAKAGIIKTGADVVCYDNQPEVMRVMEETCSRKGCTLRRTHSSDCILLRHSLDGQVFVRNGKEYLLPLLGRHQLSNAAVALAVLDVLRGRGYTIPEEAVLAGLRNTVWPARFEVLRKEPLFVLDGGHNPQCAEAMAAIIREYMPGRRFVFLTGILADKDYKEMLRSIFPFAEAFICVTPDSPRALEGSRLAEVIREMGGSAEYCAQIGEAVRKAAGCGKDIIGFGSLYMAGEIRTRYREIQEECRHTALEENVGSN